MSVVRVIVAAAAVAGVIAVLASVIRTVVLPRGIPARLGRIAFIGVRTLLLVRLRLTRRSDYRTRDRVFALQAPIGLFAQLAIWTVLIYVCFAGLFWALGGGALNRRDIVTGLEQAGSSMSTLGFDRPGGLVLHVVAFAAAAVALTLLALVITYLPSLYGAFSRREALIVKLAVRAGRVPTGPALLAHTWKLGRFEQIEEVWDSWEDWFIDVGETHTTFPQLGFFRSPHPDSHWVLAAEAVLDGAALMLTSCSPPGRSRAELCLDAGVNALVAIADFLGIPHRPAEDEIEIALSRERFDRAWGELEDLGMPMAGDQDEAWRAFSHTRARYEHLLAVLGRMTDAPRSDWSSWADKGPRHSPPLLRLHSRDTSQALRRE